MTEPEIAKKLLEFKKAQNTEGAEEFLRSLTDEEIMGYVPPRFRDLPDRPEFLRSQPFWYACYDSCADKEEGYRNAQRNLNWLQKEVGW